MGSSHQETLVLPVIEFCWTHKVGDWKHDCVLSIKVKTHQRKAQSIFRYDLDCIVLNCLPCFKVKQAPKKVDFIAGFYDSGDALWGFAQHKLIFCHVQRSFYKEKYYERVFKWWIDRRPFR